MNLVYRDGRGDVRTFSLEDRVQATIGRESGRDLVIEDRRVSRLHATIERVGGAWMLRDAGSANGTLLNGLRLSAANAITLREGDVIEVGGVRLVFGNERRQPESDLGKREVVETFFPLEDLLRDGRVRLVQEGGPDPSGLEDELGRQVSARFAGVSHARGLEQALDLLVSRLEVVVAGVFLRRLASEERKLELVAARPSAKAARNLHLIASRSWEKGGGFLSHLAAPSSDPGSPVDETSSTTCDRAHAAAPFSVSPGGPTIGVVVVEKLGATLDRTALAFVAVFGERLGRALAFRGKPEDTPISEDEGALRAGTPRQSGLAAS